MNSTPPEIIKKPVDFWCFLGDQKGKLGRHGLSEFIKFYSPWNFQKTYGFLFSGGIKVNWFTQICLIIEVKLGEDPLFKWLWILTAKTAVNEQKKTSTFVRKLSRWSRKPE